MDTFDNVQDVIGQLPILKSYTHVLICFPLAEANRASVLAALEVAARQVVAALPFLAGKVITEGKGPDNSGVFKVARCEKWEAPDHAFVRVEDRSANFPPYEELLASQAPVSSLPGSLLGVRKAFPEQYFESDDDPAPVLDIQANLVNGGLLLDLAAQHNIVDASGIFQIANLLSIAMRGEPIPQCQIDEGNCPRTPLIPLLGPSEPLLDHTELKPPVVALREPPHPALLAPYKWRGFTIPTSSVIAIKDMADSHPEDFDPSTSFVSTNDALTAFMWQRITAVRLKRLNTPHAVSKISRAVDFRRVMGLSPAYLGHMIRVANTRLTFEEIVSSSLSRLSSLLRKTVLEISNPYSLRSYVTFIANEADKSRIAYAGPFNPKTDLSSSSVAHIQVPDFGPLGKPDMLRRPSYGPLACATYMAPEVGGKGIEALVCLHEEEIELLREDGVWGGFAFYVG